MRCQPTATPRVVLVVLVFALVLAFLPSGRSAGGLPGRPQGILVAVGWTELHPALSPPARDGAGMVYDVQADRVILFGGRSGSTFRNDTWAYDITNDTWTNLTSGEGPSPRAWPQMAYDNASHRVLLFSGEVDPYRIEAAEDMWAFDYASNTWTNLTAGFLPSSRFWGSMVYDAAADRTVLFGGFHNTGTTGWFPLLNDTWTYDYRYNAWTEQPPTTALNLTGLGGMVYDSRDDLVLLYRGLTDSYRGPGTGRYVANETWRYPGTGQTWTRVSTTGQVPHRWGAGVVYDAHADKTILFGGCSAFLGPPCFADTWAFEVASAKWTNVTGSDAPSPRSSPGIAYARDGVTVLFGGGIGGLSSSTPYNDTWIYVCGLPSFPELMVVATGSPLSGVAPLSVAFAASASGGRPPYTYAWSFGDGSHGTETSPTHTYATAGRYNVTLVITDADGRTNAQTLTITVNETFVPPKSSDAFGLALIAGLVSGIALLVLLVLRRYRHRTRFPPP